jgi:hypothetical protein
MEDLIARLRAATGPDRELDAAIEAMLDGPAVRAAGGDIIANEAGICRWQEPPPHGSGTGQWRAARLRYTGSLDAALTLVPEGWTWHAGRHETGCGHAYMHNGKPHFVGVAAVPNPTRRSSEVRATTPAIALCIAALRARA